MSFTTLPFLVLVALSVAAYYLLPQRVQWMALLAASMVFYCVGGGKTVLYVFYTAVIVYGSGLLLGRFNDLRRAAPKEEKKAITARYKPYRRLCSGRLPGELWPALCAEILELHRGPLPAPGRPAPPRDPNPPV